MLIVNSEVKITQNFFRDGQKSIKLRPNSFEIISSWDEIGKKAKIKFYLKPFTYVEDKLVFSEDDTTFDIYIGDKIEIMCKYNNYESDYDNQIFKGYISDFISLGTKTQNLTIELAAEDEYWLFKNNSFDETLNSIMIEESFVDKTLQEIIDILCDKVKSTHGVTIENEVWTLNDIISFNIKKDITPGECLVLIKERYKGIKIFFRENINGDIKLYVGWAYWFETNTEAKSILEMLRLDAEQLPSGFLGDIDFDNYTNVKFSEYDVDIIDDYSKTFKFAYIYDNTKLPLPKFDLNSSTIPKNQVLVKITCTNKKTNKKITGVFPPGLSYSAAKEIRNINFEDGSFTQEELNKSAKAQWQALESGPLTGSFEIMGFPKIRHGDKIIASFDGNRLSNYIFNNTIKRNDEFVVQSVTTKLTRGGFRNIIKLISY